MRESDEIMAEYLLKGGKMLASACSICGSPLFEYKGKTFCVVCEEHKTVLSQPTPNSPACLSDVVTSPPQISSSSVDNTRIERDEISSQELVLAITATVQDLLLRINTESDTKRIRDLMMAVRDGAQGLSYLRYS